jgi:hypothetical protein
MFHIDGLNKTTGMIHEDGLAYLVLCSIVKNLDFAAVYICYTTCSLVKNLGFRTILRH